MRHQVIDGIFTQDDITDIARLYVTLPEYKGSFKLFQGYVDHVYGAEISRSKVDVFFVNGQPYANADELRAEVKHGILRVSVDYNSDPFLPEQYNLKFRALHDLQHTRSENCNFNLNGEIFAYSIAARYTANGLIRNWLFTEIVGQLCYLRVYGEFPVQRTVILPSYYRQIADNAYEVYYVE